MTDLLKLKGKLVEKDISREDLAKQIGISFSSLSRKLRGESNFTVEEAYNICGELGINDPAEMVSIFLA